MNRKLRQRALQALAAATAVTIAALGAVAIPQAAVAATDVTTEPYKVAAISAPSVEFNLDASLAKAETLTHAAAADGAELVAFGELWLPGYPKQVNTDPNWKSTDSYEKYVANSLVVGSAQWQQLLNIAQDNHVYLSMGFSQKLNNMLYMSQALIGPDGQAIQVRHKVRPSGSERNYFSDSTMNDNLQVMQTTLGRIGSLECWEHLHDQMTFPMHAKGENVHIAAWPYLPQDDEQAAWWENSSVAESAAQMYAITGGTNVITPGVGKAFIMNSTGAIVAQAGPSDDYVTATITPKDFGGADKYTSTGENSWGVLQMIAGTYPDSAKQPDDDHGTLNLNPLTADEPTPSTTPSATPSPTPTAMPSTTPTAEPTDTDSALTPANQGGLQLDPTSGPASTKVTATLPNAEGKHVTVSMRSEPVRITTTNVDDDNQLQFTIPANASIGEHHIVITDDNGTVIGWADFTVTVATGALAFTGASIGGGIIAAALLLLAGATLVHVHRTRRLAPMH